jgi:hypothetical protein
MICITFEIKYMVLFKKCNSFFTYTNQNFAVQPKVYILNNKPTLNSACIAHFIQILWTLYNWHDIGLLGATKKSLSQLPNKLNVVTDISRINKILL